MLEYCSVISLGAVAQTARALHSHCKGRGFDSRQLHQKITQYYFVNLIDYEVDTDYMLLSKKEYLPETL